MYDGHADGTPQPVRDESADGPPLGVKILIVLAVLSSALLLFSRGPGVVVLTFLFTGAVRLVLSIWLLRLSSRAWLAYVVTEAIFVGAYGLLFFVGSLYAGIQVLFGVLVLTYLASIRDVYRDDATVPA